MMDTSVSDVSAAFDVLVEKLDGKIELVSRLGAKAFESHDFDQASAAASQARKLTQFREHLGQIRGEWDALMNEEGSDADDEQPRKVTRSSNATPDSEFHRPILQALLDMGGSGSADDVLNRIGEMMKKQFKSGDLEPVSGTDTPLWRNTAQWARHSMIKDGSIRGDNETWELTDEGRARLSDRKK